MKGNRKKIRLSESELNKIIKESVEVILNEAMSKDFSDALRGVLIRAFDGLNDNEKTFLYDLLNNATWDVVYMAMTLLKPYRIYDSKK